MAVGATAQHLVASVGEGCCSRNALPHRVTRRSSGRLQSTAWHSARRKRPYLRYLSHATWSVMSCAALALAAEDPSTAVTSM